MGDLAGDLGYGPGRATFAGARSDSANPARRTRQGHAASLAPMTQRRLWIAVAVALATALATFLVLNLAGPDRQVTEDISHRYDIDSPQFRREMGVLLGPSVVTGNAIEDLQNGDEIFPAMLGAIAAAEETITFETFVYWSGDIGRQFAEALAAKARDSVAVHVLVDWVGGKMEDASVAEMEDAGVKFYRYRPLEWYSLGRLNNRTHRKILVVDGRLGFTGGVGIADEWAGDAQDPDHWRDAHFRIEGPVVAQLQAAFLDNWIETTGQVLNGPGYFPPLDSVGTTAAQVFTASPAGGSDSMRLMYLMAIAAAERTIDLSAAYFVPDDLILGALVDARQRGVRVRIVLPGEHIDSELVSISSKKTWGPLLAAGATIAEYTPTMYHTKMLIVDGVLTSVGSTNFDIRSFELNDEASLNLYSPAFAARMTRIFEADLANADPYTYEEWVNRPWTAKFAETVLEPIKSQL